MPKLFTAEQFATSAAFGDLRTQRSSGGDTQAWHTYQDTVYSKLRPGEALHASRPVLWKAAARQLKKIEAERNKPVKKVKKLKKLKVCRRASSTLASPTSSSARPAPQRAACTWSAS